MKEQNSTILLVAFVLLLAGCGDYNPPKQGSVEYSKLVSKPGDNVLYETIDLEYWLDNETEKPAVVVISFRTSSSPLGQLIGYAYGFKNGRCKYSQLRSGDSRRNIPFVERDLISSGKGPVYYAIDKPGIAKTTLTFDEFVRLQAAVENKDFIKAKQIVTEKEKRQRSI